MGEIIRWEGRWEETRKKKKAQETEPKGSSAAKSTSAKLAALSSTPNTRVVGDSWLLTSTVECHHPFKANEVVENEEIRGVAGGDEFTPQVRENPLKQMLFERRHCDSLGRDHPNTYTQFESVFLPFQFANLPFSSNLLMMGSDFGVLERLVLIISCFLGPFLHLPQLPLNVSATGGRTRSKREYCWEAFLAGATGNPAEVDWG